MTVCVNHIIATVHSGKYGPSVHVEAPAEFAPSVVREVRDQAVGAYRDVLRAQAEERLAADLLERNQQ